MKKTIFTILLVATALVVAMMGTVNAATVSSNPTEVKKGENVVVTVTTDAAVQAIEFAMAFDSAKFEYVSASTALGTPTVNPTAGVVYVSATNPTESTKTISLTFKAIADVTENATAAFSVSDFVNDANEALTNSSVNVTVVAPAADQPGDENNTNTTPGNSVVGEDGNEITKLPQTGSPVFVSVMAVIAILAVAMLVIKRVK